MRAISNERKNIIPEEMAAVYCVCGNGAMAPD